MTEEQVKYEVSKNGERGSAGLITKRAEVSMFLNEQRFEFAQRIGKMLSASTMVPEHFRNNIGNCLIALNLSERLGIDVFGLMQTSYVVHGRPGFEAKLLIALFNSRTQLFIPPLRWEFKGDFPKGKDAGCRAYAVDKETKEPLYGEWIDWDLVKAEKWNEKTGSKWLTIPGQMYRYRAASFFINAYEPGLKMGIHTVDEIEDMIIDVTPEPARTLKVEGEANGKPEYKVEDFKPGVTEEEISDTKKKETETETRKPEPPPSLYEKLMSARSTFASLVMDPANTKEIESFLPDQYDMVKARWESASKKGAGGVKQGAPWPLVEKVEKPAPTHTMGQPENVEPGPDLESETGEGDNAGVFEEPSWKEFIEGALEHMEPGELASVIKAETGQDDWLRVPPSDMAKVKKALYAYLDGK